MVTEKLKIMNIIYYMNKIYVSGERKLVDINHYCFSKNLLAHRLCIGRAVAKACLHVWLTSKPGVHLAGFSSMQQNRKSFGLGHVDVYNSWTVKTLV